MKLNHKYSYLYPNIHTLKKFHLFHKKASIINLVVQLISTWITLNGLYFIIIYKKKVEIREELIKRSFQRQKGVNILFPYTLINYTKSMH